MAEFFNNKYYQNPELAGIRKTLGDVMFGSYAGDVGDLRGMLTAEKTVEQVMRNKAAQGLGAQGNVLGGRIATSMGVKDPQADFLNAAARDYAWRKNRFDTARAHSVLGETEKQHALLKSQEGAEIQLAEQRRQSALAQAALGSERKAGAKFNLARTAEVSQLTDFRAKLLDSPTQISGVLEMYGITSISPKTDRVVAGLLVFAKNPAQVASAISKLKLTKEQENKLKAEIKASEALAEWRSAKAEEVGADDSSFNAMYAQKSDKETVMVITPWGAGGSDFPIPRSLYLEMMSEPVEEWVDKQKEAAIKVLLSSGYSRVKAEGILRFIENERTEN